MYLLFHPDKIRQEGGDEEAINAATEAFKAIQEARETLLDNEKRAQYDNGGIGGDGFVEILNVPEGMERPFRRTRMVFGCRAL